MSETEKEYTFEDAVRLARALSKSQGFWGRYLAVLETYSEDQVEQFNAELKAHDVHGDIDFILLIEGA